MTTRARGVPSLIGEGPGAGPGRGKAGGQALRCCPGERWGLEGCSVSGVARGQLEDAPARFVERRQLEPGGGECGALTNSEVFQRTQPRFSHLETGPRYSALTMRGTSRWAGLW